MVSRLISEPVCWFLIVILAINSVILEFVPDLSHNAQVSLAFDTNSNNQEYTARNKEQSQAQTTSSGKSLQTIHFPQVNHRAASPLSDPWVPPRWFVTPPSSSNLKDPANIPTIIYQDDARYLEKYMKNYYEDGENKEQSSLDLASSNNRATKPDIKPQQQPQRRIDGKAYKSLGSENNQGFQTAQINLRRPDQYRDVPETLIKKGRVDDVVLLGQNQKNRYYPPSPAKQLVNSKLAHLDKWSQNCITRTAPRTAECEDHLIKRLNQDATEGRTVLDVGRRVCCALFWHKDCISRLVVETCPDSSPAAADFLLGSRKLDLTLSCQKFNRDGCNGSQGIKIGISNILISFFVVTSYWISIEIFLV